MNILVTGGAGYLGSTMIPELLSKGFNITVVDNFMYKQPSLNHVCHSKNFKVVNGDVRLKETIAPLLKNSDVIIPLAAYVGAPLCLKDPINASQVNKDAIKLMLDNLSQDQIILMPTTNSAYGSGDKDNYCTETTPLKPISLYAKEKVEVEKMLCDHSNFISYRLATVFGMSPRMRIDLLVNDFVYRSVYDGFMVLYEPHFKRNYIHVKDVTNAFIHGIENYDSMKNEIYNVGLSDANISKLELCNEIKRIKEDFIFFEAQFAKDQDQRNYIVSNDKIEKTGFKPTFSLTDGIIELIKGFTMLKNSKYGNI